MAESEGPTGADDRQERLTEGDRELLLTVSRLTAERSILYERLPEEADPLARELRYERIDLTGERLVDGLEAALKSPTLAGAFAAAGFEPDGLRQMAREARWDGEIANAIYAVRSGVARDALTAGPERSELRPHDAATTLSSVADDQRAAAVSRLLKDLEGQARGKAGEDDAAVASRLAASLEEVIELVPVPVAEELRAALSERTVLPEIDGAGVSGHLDGVGPELAKIFNKDEAGRYSMSPRDRRAERDLENAEAMRIPASDRRDELPSSLNRIEAADDGGNGQPRRQTEEFAELIADQTMAGQGSGVFGRLRQMLGRGDAVFAYGGGEDGEGASVPEALRRRYGVHVSGDGRKIELFEAGAKAAAITLNAGSIRTSHNEGVVIADVVALARDRGWQTLRADGTAEFRDAVWLEANKAGLTVNHQPSRAIQAAYEKWERDRPPNQIAQAPTPSSRGSRPEQPDLAKLFTAKSPEDRLADPRLRNAQLELMVGLRTAEKELGKSIAAMPDVQRAMTAAVGQQLANGRVFEPPFVKPERLRAATRQVANPRIEADRIPAPRQ